MTRVEELTDRFIEGTTSPEEMVELDALVTADPAAMRAHLLMIDIEGLLLAEGPGPDLRAKVLETIEKARESRILGVVIPHLEAHRPSATHPRRRPVRLATVSFGLALAAAAMVIGLRSKRPSTDPPTAPSNGPVAWVAKRVHGSVSAIRRGSVTLLQPSATLVAGDEVETGAGGEAHLVRGGAELLLAPRGRLSIETARENSALKNSALVASIVGLKEGRLQAALPPAGRALSVRTPHAWATAIGTRFSLSVDARETRLDVTEGRVIFRRVRDDSTIEVTAGQQALATVPELASGGLAADGGGVPDASGGTQVLAFDFEDGNADFDQGHIVRGSSCLGGGACLQGTLRASVPLLDYWMVSRSLAHAGGVLFFYNHRQVLMFDYWVGADTAFVYVQMWGRDQKQNYAIRLRDIVRERWGRAVVRLSDLGKFRDRRLEDGDPLSSLVITGGHVGGKPLYVDNIQVVEWPTGPLPSSSGGN